MKSYRFILAVLIAAFCLPQAALARRPMGTTMTGVVTSVDHSVRSLTLAQDRGPVRGFVYTQTAKLWTGTENQLPSVLKPGMRIQVNLHQPLFGPDFVRQIKLIGQVPAKSSRN